jgi:uridylate kinase
MNGKKVMVISLGGSLIVPAGEMDVAFLEKFKRILRKHYRTWKFIVVCGGGSIARKYIEALRRDGKSREALAAAGIRATRMNALFLMQFFGKEANDRLPKNMNDVKHNLAKNNVVFCGALRYDPASTSDGTAAKLAHLLGSDFVNMTNVRGLYSDNPLTNKKAKFIPYQTWREFESRALSMKFYAGQHFVLDQHASILIREHKIKTYIIGKDLRNLSKILHGKKFVGTLIYG